LVDKFGDQRWNKVSKCMPGRSEIQCFNRWLELKNDSFVSKGPWTREEDDILRQMVEEHGAKNWSAIAAALPGRIGKQCRERWHNHLDPNIRKEKWSQEEDRLILAMHE
jgi:myb proto-oncogene protein